MRTLLCNIIWCKKILLWKDNYVYRKGLNTISLEEPVYKCERCKTLFEPKFYKQKFRVKNPSPWTVQWSPKYK